MSSSEDRLKWSLIALVFLLDLLGLAWLDLRISLEGTVALFIFTPMLVLVGLFYSRIRVIPKFATCTFEMAYLLTFTAVAGVLSYIAVGLSLPLIDEELVRIDAALGFEWLRYVEFVNAHPLLGILSTGVYGTTAIQIALTAAILPLAGRPERSRELVLAIMIGGIFTILISALLPASGALAHYQPAEAFYGANRPVVDLAYKSEFFAMRDGEIGTLILPQMKGLIAFPSYHAVLAVLTVAVLRGIPWIFWPLVALNVAVLLSTPIDGGHHLIDMLAGVAVALGSLAIAVRLRAALAERDRRRAGAPREAAHPVAAMTRPEPS